MATLKEQMMVRAVAERTKVHPSFRNRHIAETTGLARQDVNRYLNKWRERGYVDKNPLAKGEWILLDMAGLVTEMMTTTEPAKLEHSNHELFRKDALQILHDLVDVYVALRMLRANSDKLKNDLEGYLDKAIDELRNERKYIHTKVFSQNRARQIVSNARPMVEALGIDVDKLVESKEQPILSLVPSEE